LEYIYLYQPQGQVYSDPPERSCCYCSYGPGA